MFKYRNLFIKVLSISLSLIILSSAVSFPAFAAVILEQAKYNNILNTDLQGKSSTLQVQPTVNAPLQPQQGNRDKDHKTDAQRKEEYKKNLENDIKNFKANRYIVKYRDEQSIPQFINGDKKNDIGKNYDSSKITAAGIESSKKISGNKNRNYAIVSLKNNLTPNDFLSAMKSAGIDSNIEYVQPDYTMTASATSTDPLYLQQWGLKTISNSPVTIIGAGVSDAWANSQGEGVIVAVLDSGIDITHPDLAGIISSKGVFDFYNYSGNYAYNVSSSFTYSVSSNYSLYYDAWHGTHVSGIIAAQKDNNLGITGVAPKATILPIKIFQGGVAYTSDIINAIAYADSMGAKVINCSWGSRFNNPALEDAISKSSALFVCATGNNLYDTDNYPIYPAAYSTTHNNVISVAAIDQSGKLCRFSNYGPTTVDIAAPGRNILSTWINNDYQSIDGTSMSAAFVSGAAALVFAKGTYTTADAVKARLISSADSVTGLQDKIKGGKILDCAYATGNQAAANSNSINVIDNQTLPVIIPNTSFVVDSYQQSNAENYVVSMHSMPTGRQLFQTVVLNGNIYAIGGIVSGAYTSTVVVYDPISDSWSSAASMNTARSNFGAVVYDGKIYVMGGKNLSGNLDSIESYDPATNTWTVLSSKLPQALYDFSATLIPDTSMVYIIGGRNGDGSTGYDILNTVYDYNFSTATWTTHSSLSLGISSHSAFYYNGKIYIEGGLSTSYIPAKSFNEYQYTISNGTTSPSVLYRGSPGVSTNDRYISAETSGIMQSSLLVDNTTTEGFYVSVSQMISPRDKCGIALVNGKVYFIGGSTSSDKVEMMDLGWQQKASLPTPISNYKSVSNGREDIRNGWFATGKWG